MALILAIDQGTTSTRAILFQDDGRPVASAQRPLPAFYPADGWVEQDAEHIWTDTLFVARQVMGQAGVAAKDVAVLGITNQRETTVVWDRTTGRPIANAIVWQDRRTAARCAALVAAGHEPKVTVKTGLVIDPYFSATKVGWLLDKVPDARAAAAEGRLAFGTIDSFLLWRLTGGRVHATDATNASRTLLYDIGPQAWDDELLELFGVPRAILPNVMDSAAWYGRTDPALFGAAIPITGIAGDQQAATVGQACLEPGMVKATYGTGCFALINTGEDRAISRHRLLSTIGYRLKGEPTYALEGSIFAAGAAIQWLHEGLGIIADAAETEHLAAAAEDSGGVYMVPAFVGLGAPYWDPGARGAIVGLTRDSGRAQIACATLEAVGYQTRDLITAMAADWGSRPASLRVDGGMVRNDWLCQFLADILDLAVERPKVTETTALGAAFLAALGGGLIDGTAAIAQAWQLDRRFEPAMAPSRRDRLYSGWQEAVARTLTRR